MCFRCSAPNAKFLIQDVQTGFVVCEECGTAVPGLDPAHFAAAQLIWEINPLWPRFSSFEDLLDRVLADGAFSLPVCRQVPSIPSRLLTFCVEQMASECH